MRPRCPSPLPAFLGSLLTLLASALVVAGCGGASVEPAGADADAPVRGGTAWMETAQEPPVLNSWLAAGGMGITKVLTAPMRSSWVVIDDQSRWQPQLATTVPTLANGGVRALPGGGMRIDFEIEPRAVWSDGVPITCEDLRFTWRTVMDERWAIGSRVGWELVERIDCPAAKRATIVLRTHYAPYLHVLLGSAPLPAHELAGVDFDHAWSNRITLSSGPFTFERWDRGDRLVMVRNPRWWGGDGSGALLDRLVVRFVPDASTMKLDLLMGDADLVGLPPDTNLPAELAAIDGVDHVVLPGAGSENLVLNTSRFPLADARVRQAVAYAVDRDVLVDTVLRAQVPRLDSTLLPHHGSAFHPVFDRYRHDLDAAAARMRDAGFTRSEPGPWTAADGRPARLVLTTMTGNPLRLRMTQLLEAQLIAAGFDVEILMVKPEVFFPTVVARGRYDIAVHAFSQGLDPSLTTLFACSEIATAPDWSGKNNFKYCRRDVDAMLARSDAELDPERRALVLRELTERIASDVPTLPVYQQPDTLAWNRRLRGLRPNAMGVHTWNTGDWWVREP